MNAEVQELRRIAEAQDAYGKWNTAPAWNRYEAARRAAQTPLVRLACTVARGIGLSALVLLSYAPIALGIYHLTKGLF